MSWFLNGKIIPFASSQKENEKNTNLMMTSSTPMTFIHKLMDTIRFIDEEAPSMSREDVLDHVRARLVDITHAFVAYPHCANFSLMPEGGE